MPVSRKDDRNLEEEFPDIERRGASSSTHRGSSTADGETSIGSARPEWQQILHRVPPQVRENKKHIYDPVIVSLGPYHHSQPQFRRFEEFKNEVVNIMLKSDGGANDKRLLFSGQILEREDEIRRFYGGLSRDEYGDEALADMMLRDACFILSFMKLFQGNEEIQNHVIRHLGNFEVALMSGDIRRLENQIPWWVIKLLIGLVYDNGNKNEGEALICNFLGLSDEKLNQVEEPLHLLEALRNSNINEAINVNIDPTEDKESTNDLPCPNFIFKWWRKKSSQNSLIKELQRPFRSVKELKAKGIYFRPSSHSFNDVHFNSYSLYGTLHIPFLFIHSGTMTHISNIIALEMSPGNLQVESVVTSYVNFMKSLIEMGNDVKELQEEGILISYLEDNDQIVRMFKEIDTYGRDGSPIFEDIKMRIDEHCSSKAKTWIAELIHTYFRTPWTAIALFAAGFLLCLTFLQTYYTIDQSKKR